MRSIPILLLLAGLAVLCWFFWPADAAPPPGTTAPAPGATSDVDPIQVAPERGRAVAGDAKAAEESRRVDVAGGLEVRGRCVREEGDRGAVAGCTVEVSWRSSEPGRYRVQTGDDGRFSLRIPAVDERFMVTVTHEAYASLEGYLPGAANRVIDAGDIPLARGPLLRAEVRDAAGVAVPGVAFNLTWNGNRGDQLRPVILRGLKSDARGELHSPGRLAPGQWAVTCNLPHRLESAPKLTVPRDLDVLRAQLQVRTTPPEDRIGGRVVDARDRAPVRCSVQAVNAAGSTVAFAVCDPAGVFLLARQDPLPRDPVTLRVSTHGFELYTSPAPVAWGSRDLSIAMQPSAALALHVVHAAGGTPVERYRAHWFEAMVQGSARWPRGVGPEGPHGDGRCAITGVPEGTGFVVVVPDDAGLCPSDATAYTQPSATPLEVRLHERRPLRVRLLDAADAPFEGSALRLLRQRGDVPPQLAGPALGRGQWQLMAMERFRNRPVLLDSGTTDAAGRATLRWRKGDPAPLYLEVRSAAHLPILVRVEITDEELVLRPRRGGRIHGEVQPAEVLARLGQRSTEVKVRAQPSTDIEGARPVEVAIDGDGRYRIDALAAGRWELRLVVRVKAGTDTEEFPLRHEAPCDVGEGAILQRDFHLGAYDPGRAQGVLRVDGAPAAMHRILCLQVRGPRMQWIGAQSWRAVTDAAGRFHFPFLNPGAYAVFVRGSGANAAGLVAPALLEVPPGADVQQDVELTRARLRVTVLDSAGAPLRRQPVYLSAHGQVAVEAATGEDGVAAFDAVAAGAYDLHLARYVGGTGSLKVGGLTLQAGENVREVRAPPR